MANPRIHMVAMQEAALEVLKGMSDPGLEKLLKERKIQIGFEGAFGSNSVSPRGLTSRLINKLVQVEGIVTKVSSVRAKLTKSVHLSADNKYTTREHRDASSADIGLLINGRLHLPQSALPTKDENG